MPQAAVLPQSPQPPTPADLNKASFHVFIELPLRHFPAQSGSLRLWEQGWGWGGEWAKARSWGWAAATPHPHHQAHSPEEQDLGVGGGNAGSYLFFCKMGPASLPPPHPGTCSQDLRGVGLRLAVLCRTVLALV